MKCIYILRNKTTKFVFIYNIILVFSIVLIVSCEKVLDKEPLDSFSELVVWQDASLCESFVNRTYRMMPCGYWWEDLRLASLSDEATSRDGGYLLINQGKITSSSLGDLDCWWNAQSISNDNYYNMSYYPVITNCNIFIKRMSTSTIDNTVKNRMIGEMKALRAYSYFRLVAFFGGVPLIKEPFSLDEDLKVPRSTYDECMNFVIKELDEAADLLPLDYDNANKGRITKGAVLAIKSRALLYMASPLNNPTNNQAKWQAAADAAKAVIDLNKYALYSDYQKLFLRSDAYNSEIIWCKPIWPEMWMDGAAPEIHLYPNGYEGYCEVSPLQNLVDDYELLNGKLPKDDPAYDPQNPYVNRDPRFYMSILYDGAPFKGRAVEFFKPGGKDTNEGSVQPWNASWTAYSVKKFIEESITSPSNSVSGNAPWTFFRYAEILLNYAEAKYFLGDEPTCREYINKIRSRPGVNMPPVTESGAGLLARLQHERRIELVFEEHRWFDVRRWKIASTVLNKPAYRMSVIKDNNTGIKTYTIVSFQDRAFFDRNYLLPIPQKEIEKNELLVQNPGY